MLLVTAVPSQNLWSVHSRRRGLAAPEKPARHLRFVPSVLARLPAFDRFFQHPRRIPGRFLVDLSVSCDSWSFTRDLVRKDAHVDPARRTDQAAHRAPEHARA